MSCGAGLSQFYKAVFSHHSETPEVYCGEFRQLAGKTFGCAGPSARLRSQTCGKVDAGAVAARRDQHDSSCRSAVCSLP